MDILGSVSTSLNSWKLWHPSSSNPNFASESSEGEISFEQFMRQELKKKLSKLPRPVRDLADCRRATSHFSTLVSTLVSTLFALAIIGSDMFRLTMFHRHSRGWYDLCANWTSWPERERQREGQVEQERREGDRAQGALQASAASAGSSLTLVKAYEFVKHWSKSSPDPPRIQESPELAALQASKILSKAVEIFSAKLRDADSERFSLSRCFLPCFALCNSAPSSLVQAQLDEALKDAKAARDEAMAMDRREKRCTVWDVGCLSEIPRKILSQSFFT